MPAFFVSAENTLVLTQGQDPDPSRQFGASDDLVIWDGVGINFKLESIVQGPNPLYGGDMFQDSATTQFISKLLFDFLVFSDEIALGGTVLGDATNTIVFAETAVTALKPGIVSHTIALSDSAIGRAPVRKDMGHNLSQNIDALDPEDISDLTVDLDFGPAVEAILALNSLRDEVSFSFGIKDASITTYLSLSEDVSPFTSVLSVNNHIEFLDSARKVLHEEVVSYLYFQEVLSAVQSYHASSTLAFTHAAAYNLIASFAVASDLFFSHVSLFTTDGTTPHGPNQVTDPRQQYNPDGTIPEIFCLPKTSPTSGQVTFKWPDAEPAPAGGFPPTLVLRTPRLRNQETLNYRRVRRRTRGGQMQVYRRDIWPKWVRLQMTYTALSESNRQQIFRFFKITLGLYIEFIDWEDRTWTGVVTTPQSAFEQLGKGCQHEIPIEFQGVLTCSGAKDLLIQHPQEYTSGTVEITGYDVTVSHVPVTLGTVSVTGYDTAISADREVTATTGTASIAGLDTQVAKPVAALYHVVEVTGYDVIVETAIKLSLGTVDVAGLDVSVNWVSLDATLGTISVVGLDVVVS